MTARCGKAKPWLAGLCWREPANKKSLLIQNVLQAAKWRQFELTNCDINMSGIKQINQLGSQIARLGLLTSPDHKSSPDNYKPPVIG